MVSIFTFAAGTTLLKVVVETFEYVLYTYRKICCNCSIARGTLAFGTFPVDGRLARFLLGVGIPIFH